MKVPTSSRKTSRLDRSGSDFPGAEEPYHSHSSSAGSRLTQPWLYLLSTPPPVPSHNLTRRVGSHLPGPDPTVQLHSRTEGSLSKETQGRSSLPNALPHLACKEEVPAPHPDEPDPADLPHSLPRAHSPKPLPTSQPCKATWVQDKSNYGWGRRAPRSLPPIPRAPAEGSKDLRGFGTWQLLRQMDFLLIIIRAN